VGVTIRPAGGSDLEPVARIYAHYVLNSAATFEERPPTAADWRRRLDGVRALRLPFLVAEADGEVVGYAYCTLWRLRPAYRHTVEESVYLAPRAVGQGIGRSLLDHLVRDCADAGVRQIIAVVADTGDDASAALHRRCGFVEAGRLSRVGHKHGRWLDTILLQRSVPWNSPAE
jgi:L-amino acid N-acyltransferase YncA